jgi:calcineurin-like phosphoesterase family protein
VAIFIMSNIFLSSDLHLGHAAILNFKRSDGVTSLRVFEDVTHMNEYIIMQHNRVVQPSDKWYCLGDIAMNKKFLPILSRMNGEKILIKGNHDLDKASEYLKYFKDIRAVHQLNGFILSHIPIHPNSLSRWKGCIHGHLHSNVVTLGDTLVPDTRYTNVSVECLIDYTPVSLEEVSTLVKIQT